VPVAVLLATTVLSACANDQAKGSGGTGLIDDRARVQSVPAENG
jgi:hypothetical protein